MIYEIALLPVERTVNVRHAFARWALLTRAKGDLGYDRAGIKVPRSST